MFMYIHSKFQVCTLRNGWFMAVFWPWVSTLLCYQPSADPEHDYVCDQCCRIFNSMWEIYIYITLNPFDIPDSLGFFCLESPITSIRNFSDFLLLPGILLMPHFYKYQICSFWSGKLLMTNSFLFQICSCSSGTLLMTNSFLF